jgi:hypothetical protein
MTENHSPAIRFRGEQRFQSLLGRVLARQYEGVAAEPPPEEFLTLLRLADHIQPSSEQTG